MEQDSTKWTKDDLLALIQGQIEENGRLDYKRSDALDLTQEAKKKELSKDVSAFANATGGTIVYGIPEANHLPQPFDAGCDSHVITKERVEQTIQGRIQPRVVGVHINPVRLDGNLSGRVAYVVTIPQSVTAHQADDKRYYRRYNFESVPMDDYEIRDVMNRAKHPIVAPSITYRTIARTSDEHQYGLKVVLENLGVMSAHNIKFEFDFPAAMITETAEIFYCGGANEILKRRPHYESSYFSVVRFSKPLFPKEKLHLPEFEAPALRYKMNSALQHMLERHSPSLAWRLYADDALPAEGDIPLSDLNNF